MTSETIALLGDEEHKRHGPKTIKDQKILDVHHNSLFETRIMVQKHKMSIRVNGLFKLL